MRKRTIEDTPGAGILFALPAAIVLWIVIGVLWWSL